jgi:FkbM family methyltransferase
MWGQFGEVLAIEPIFRRVTNGFYVDIGSHDGITDSNTLKFAQSGWRGICVEPHKLYYPQLVKNRPTAKCLDVAIWKEDAESIIFHATKVGGWSRLVEPLEKADHPVETSYPVKAITMRRLLEENAVPAPFDLLSIDVELHEPEVLSTFDVGKYRPRIVIIEDMRLKGFDDVFKEYRGVYGWEQGKPGSNVIYCLYEDDYKIVKARYR